MVVVKWSRSRQTEQSGKKKTQEPIRTEHRTLCDNLSEDTREINTASGVKYSCFNSGLSATTMAEPQIQSEMVTDGV